MKVLTSDVKVHARQVFIVIVLDWLFFIVLQLVTAAPYMVQANYTSPKTKKTNLLQFLLEQSTVCKMTVSKYWNVFFLLKVEVYTIEFSFV